MRRFEIEARASLVQIPLASLSKLAWLASPPRFERNEDHPKEKKSWQL
jgi:hypothetical protein